MARPTPIAGLALAFALTLAPHARADVSAADDAAATAIFKEGRALMAQHKYVEACAKFSAANALRPTAGTQLTLADCFEKAGLTASAYGEFRKAKVSAQEHNDKDREAEAQRRMDLIEPKLSKLTLIVAPQLRGAGIVIKRDGKEIPEAAWDSAVPVDPGDHKIEATGAGKQPWSSTVQPEAKPGTTTVQVPALQDAPAAPGAPTAEPREYWSAQRIAGVSIAGIGVASAIAGAVFGARAISKMSLSNQTCHPMGSSDACDAPGLAARHDAGTAATVSDVTLAVGAAAVVAGAAVFFTAPSGAKAPASTTAPRIGVGPVGATGAGLVWKGAW